MSSTPTKPSPTEPLLHTGQPVQTCEEPTVVIAVVESCASTTPPPGLRCGGTVDTVIVGMGLIPRLVMIVLFAIVGGCVYLAHAVLPFYVLLLNAVMFGLIILAFIARPYMRIRFVKRNGGGTTVEIVAWRLFCVHRHTVPITALGQPSVLQTSAGSARRLEQGAVVVPVSGIDDPVCLSHGTLALAMLAVDDWAAYLDRLRSL